MASFTVFEMMKIEMTARPTTIARATILNTCWIWMSLLMTASSARTFATPSIISMSEMVSSACVESLRVRM